MLNRRGTIPKALLALLVVVACATEAAAAEKMKTVVVGLKSRRGVDPALGEAMSDIVQGEFAADKRRTVFGRADVKRLVEFEAEKQLMGCDTDSCLSEIASALDVDRIITGTLDKIGSSYFVVINELESDGVAPIARVQGRIPLDEDKLFRAVADMSRKLLRKSARYTATQKAKEAKDGDPEDGEPASVATRRPAEPEPPPPSEPVYDRPKIERGLLVTSATPATVKIGDEDYGQTPVALADLPAGDYVVELQAGDGEPLMLDVTVFEDGVTTVETEFDQELNPSADALEEYESSKLWHTIGAFSKIGGGAVSSVLLAPCLGITAFAALQNVNLDVAGYTGLAVCSTAMVAGCGLAGWGLIDFFVAPEKPLGDGIGTEVLIMPPEDQGDRKHLTFPRGMAH